MTSGRKRAVVFDLDGTLVDSRVDLAEAVNEVRAELGLAPLPLAAVVGMVGRGARALVASALGDDADEGDLDHAVARFLVHYEPICTRNTRPYPGIDRLLRDLGRILPLALLTNKPERLARKIVDHLGWSDLFEVVVGGDSLPVRKPDPGGLEAIAQRLGCEPGEMLLVGDSRTDEATAAGAGSAFVFVEWGFASGEERAALLAHPSVGEPAALAALIAA